MKYFRLREHVEFPGGSWHLGKLYAQGGERLDSRIFNAGKSVKLEYPLPLSLQIKRPGPSLDYDCDSFGMPVVTHALGEALIKIVPDEIQLFPVEIIGAKGSYDILNITQTVDCLDETRTRGYHWTPEIGGRVRKYYMLADEHVDPERTNGHKLFRLKNWEVVVICSQEVKDVFDALHIKGALFDPAV